MTRASFLLAFLLTARAFAQDPSPAPAAPKFEPPQAAAEMDQMRRWEGQWKTLATFAKGGVMPDGGEMKGSYTAARGLNGHAYFGDYAASGTAGEFKGHMVREFDPVSKKWKTWWFDSWVPGNADLSVGEVSADGNFVTESESENQGNKFKMRITERWPDDNKVDQVYESDSGKGWSPVMSITYTRKGKWKEKPAPKKPKAKKDDDSKKDEPSKDGEEKPSKKRRKKKSDDKKDDGSDKGEHKDDKKSEDKKSDDKKSDDKKSEDKKSDDKKSDDKKSDDKKSDDKKSDDKKSDRDEDDDH